MSDTKLSPATRELQRELISRFAPGCIRPQDTLQMEPFTHAELSAIHDALIAVSAARCSVCGAGEGETCRGNCERKPVLFDSQPYAKGDGKSMVSHTPVSSAVAAPNKSRPHWRLADEDPGSDVGVTFEKAYAADDYDHEPDCHVFSVHVWNNGTRACQTFAEELCALMNKHGVKPPEGWEP